MQHTRKDKGKDKNLDILKSIGENGKTSTLFLTHAPGAVKDVADQILEFMLVAGRADK